MEQRVQVTNPLEGRAPRATSVGGIGNTFNHIQLPQAQPDNSLADLGQALGVLSGSLQQQFQQELQVLDEKDIKDGQAAFLKNQMGFAEAVKAGKLPAGASPHFKRGVRAAHLKSLADQFGSGLRQAQASSAVANTDDPDALQEWVAGYSQDFMSNNLGEFSDEEIAEFYSTRAAGHVSTLNQRHTEKRIVEIERQAVESIGVQANQLMDMYEENADDIDHDPTDLGGALGDLTNPKNPESHVANGMSRGVANDAIVDAVVTRSKDTGNIEYLQSLRKIKTPGGTLADIPRYHKLIVAAEASIGTQARQKITFDQAQAKKMEDARDEAVLNEGYKFIETGDDVGLFAHRQQMIKAGLGEEAADLYRVMESRKDAALKVREQPGVVSFLYDQVLNNPNRSQSIIFEAEAKGMIKGSTAQSLQKFAQINKETGALTTRAVKHYERQLSGIILGDEETASEAAKASAFQAGEIMRDHMTDWLDANKDKDGKYLSIIPRKVLAGFVRDTVEEMKVDKATLESMGNATPTPPPSPKPPTGPASKDNPYISMVMPEDVSGGGAIVEENIPIPDDQNMLDPAQQALIDRFNW